ncbi:Ankyrin repeats (3 copies) [Novymonas esmeraldas]|uniref:Ankyrin repeats (3 copies) n=1 Tax=Novymonas esmeraldas TaxID=1808958 RepID=A0AAW0ERG3_9TRYP
MGKQRRYKIAPELRAIARAVSDADVQQFPDLAPAPGRSGPSVGALRRITTELNNGAPLSTQDFKLFRAAYEECRQHLHSVRNGVITSGTPVADVLVLAVRMDTLATDLGLSLLTVFPALREVHTYLLELSDRLALGRGELQRQSVLLDRFVHFLYHILERGERALRDFEAWEAQRDGAGPERASTDVSVASPTAHGATPVDSPTQATQHDSELESHLAFPQPSPGPQRFPTARAATRPGARRMTSTANAAADADVDTAVAAAAADGHDGALLSGRRRLPGHIADSIASANADLVVHFAHIRWYVRVTDHASVYFDAHQYVEEHALRAAWDTHVGRNRAACTQEEFQPLLSLFPPWTHPAVKAVVDFKSCGIISLYSLQRLLRVWGPLQLLEVNLRHDMERDAVDLSEPFTYLAASLAGRPDAAAGDYVVGLTDVVGELRVAVLRRARGHRWHLWAAADPVPRPPPPQPKTLAREEDAAPTSIPSRRGLVTVSYTLSHSTGAWMVKGLAREEFDSVADACAAFAEIFQRPCGQPLVTLRDATAVSERVGRSVSEATPLEPSRAAGAAAAAAAVLVANQVEVAAGNASALHRACYRNNARYVSTLLNRGGGTVVNAALVDPLVCDSFCWTPLLCAVNNPHSDPVDVVLQLLAAGAEVEYTDDADCTALYYAIANGYADTTRVLLEHCPTLSTSPYTVPLLVAIGAHDCHQRECDVRRLMEVVPAAAVLRVVVAYESSLALVALAATVVEEKLNGVDHRVSTAERHLVAQRCSAGAAGAERYTAAETEQLRQWVHHHTRCCLQARQDVQEAVRVLYARQYALSWRAWLDVLDAGGKDSAAARRLTRGVGAPPRPRASVAQGSLTALLHSRGGRGSTAGGLSLSGHTPAPKKQVSVRVAFAQQLEALESIEYVI